MSWQRKLAFAIIGLLLLLALAWAFVPAPMSVETARVERGTFTQTIDEDGITEVRDRYHVTAPVAGTMLRPAVRPGDSVGRDQPLAVIVPSAAQMLDVRTRAEMTARVEAAAARLARAGAAARQAAASVVQSEADQRRLTELAKQGYVSATELERSALSLDLRRKDREASIFEQDAANHDLQQARAALRDNAGNLAATGRGSWTVRAPIAGRILRVVHESAGPIAVGDEILELADTSRQEARIDVLTGEATQIRPQAFVELDAGDGTQLMGRVRLVEPAARTKVSALGVEEQRVDVIVDLLPNERLGSRIGDGFRVDARIEVARAENALLVPLAALFRDGSRWAVFRVVADHAKLTPIDLGLRGNDNAVVQNGLAIGDRVIIYPGDSVRDAARVRF